MHGRAREPGQRVFPAEGQEAKEKVDGLEDRNGAHSAIEVGGEEVPEEFGPEVALEGGCGLVCREGMGISHERDIWGKKGDLVGTYRLRR